MLYLALIYCFLKNFPVGIFHLFPYTPPSSSDSRLTFLLFRFFQNLQKRCSLNLFPKLFFKDYCLIIPLRKRFKNYLTSRIQSLLIQRPFHICCGLFIKKATGVFQTLSKIYDDFCQKWLTAFRRYFRKEASSYMFNKVLNAPLVPGKSNELHFINFQPMFHFYNPWKHQKTNGFLMFSGSIEVEHWLKIGWLNSS